MITGENVPRWKRYLAPRFLAGKVRERGAIWCFKAGAGRIYRGLRWVAGKVKRRLFRYLEISSYKVLPHCSDLIDIFSYTTRPFRGSRRTADRVLGIINFNDHPFGLGDAIIFQENLCILKEGNALQQVDICIVNDAYHIRNKVPRFDWRNEWELKKYAIMQTMFLNPYIGNVFYFNDYKDYIHFRMQNAHRYIHFPNGREQFLCDMRPLRQYYQAHGRLPRLSADRPSLNWARGIIDTHIHPAKLVVVQIRNSFGIKKPADWHEDVFIDNGITRKRSPAAKRDSNLPEWEKFFESLDPNQFKVICVCLDKEIVPAWRDTGLVLFSKDLGADFLKDCALIQLSYLSLFPPSGMIVVAFFTGTPCLMLNMPIGYSKAKRDVRHQLSGDLEDYQQYNFQSPFQRIIWEKDTFESIKSHFDQLVSDLENVGWESSYQEQIQIR